MKYLTFTEEQNQEFITLLDEYGDIQYWDEGVDLAKLMDQRDALLVKFVNAASRLVLQGDR